MQNSVIVISYISLSLSSIDSEKVFYLTEDYSQTAQEYTRNNSQIPSDINDVLYDLIRKELEEETDNEDTH